MGSVTFTDERGRAFFDAGVHRRYEARASDPTRRSLPSADGLDGLADSLETPLTLKLHELKVGAVRVPGEQIMSSGCLGLAPVDAAEVPRALVERWPDATWLCGFDGSGSLGSKVELELDVLGFAPTAVTLPLVPVTRFVSPVVVGAAGLQPWPWFCVPVVLRDPDGEPLPPPTMDAARLVMSARRLLDPGQEPRHRHYALAPLRDGSEEVWLPEGRYELRLNGISSLGAGALRWKSTLGEHFVEAATEALDVALPVVLRALQLRLQYKNEEPRSSSIKARSAAGFEGSWVVDGAEGATLLLPLGPVELTLEVHGPEGEFWRLERTIEVRDPPGAEIVWSMP
ncbi:hypothetical protein [Planctomycetes bacterium Poly30]|uniref:hypothetical protein n=1 Tax=Saltatorellus ferox TaxID=2528018 RepID=UPI0011A0C296